MIKTKKVIEIYSDGSGNTMDGDAGWGWVLAVDGVKTYEGSGFMRRGSNNVAELTAAVNGLTAVRGYISNNSLRVDDCLITLISDSQLVLHYADNTWKCKKEHLKQLNLSIRRQYNALNASGKWVKGHSGNEHNERCDALAGTSRKEGRRKHTIHMFAHTLIKLGLVTNPTWLIEASASLKIKRNITPC